jgi:hypothetical protein
VDVKQVVPITTGFAKKPGMPTPLPLQSYSHAPYSGLAGGSEAAAPAAERPAVLLLPVLLVFVSLVFINAWIYITGADPWYVAAGGSVAIIGGAGWLLERSLWKTALPGVPSPMMRSMVAFATAWAISTGIVAISGGRLDSGKFVPQSAVLLIYMAAFFGVAAAARRFEMRRAVLIVCHTLSVIASLYILLDFAGITSFESFNGRYFGFLGDPAPWLLSFPLVIYFATSRFYYAAMVGLPILLTASRGPAFVIGCAILLLFTFAKARRLKYVVTLVPIAIILLFQSDVTSGLLGRLSATSLSQNDRIWTSLNGLKLFQMFPIWGAGYNGLEYYFPYNAVAQKLGEFSIPTSSVVQMLSEGGLLLFLPYLAFMITASIAAVRILRSDDEEGDPMMVGTAVWLIAMLWANQSAAWFLVGSTLAPLVFGISGLVSGMDMRRRDRQAVADYQLQLYRAAYLRANPPVRPRPL